MTRYSNLLTISAAVAVVLTSKINVALVADDPLKAAKINVDTRDDKGVLTGTAPDAGSRDRATAMAKAVGGVVVVDNRLTVEPKG